MTNFAQGLKAERWAAWILRVRGFSILARRYKARGGEIDLVARRGDLLVFIEVKYRHSLDSALHAITPRNQARILACAQAYLAEHDPQNVDTYRFDVMAFAPGKRLRPQFSHIEHAFELF